MKALIIYANYRENSFTGALRDNLAENFHNNGHEVVIRDLYDIKFNPVLTKKDLESIEKEIFPIDIMNEQKFIQWADIICFVYPIWWSGMPAILKGYIERILVQGYAFEFKDDKAIPKLEGKKVVIINSTSAKNVLKDKMGIDALNTLTHDCIFGFCGMEVIEHKYFEAVSRDNQKQINKIFAEIKEIATRVL